MAEAEELHFLLHVNLDPRRLRGVITKVGSDANVSFDGWVELINALHELTDKEPADIPPGVDPRGGRRP